MLQNYARHYTPAKHQKSYFNLSTLQSEHNLDQLSQTPHIIDTCLSTTWLEKVLA